MTVATQTKAQAALSALVKCFEHADVTELCLASGQTARVNKKGSWVAITKAALSAPQIHAMWEGTPVAEAIARADAAPQQFSHVLSGRILDICVQKNEHGIELRMVNGNAPLPLDARAFTNSMPPAKAEDVAQAVALPVATGMAPAPCHTPEKHVPADASRSVSAETTKRSESLPSADDKTPPILARSQSPQAPKPFTDLLIEAHRQGASDLHIVTNVPAKLRRSGQLIALGETWSQADVLQLIGSILSESEQQLLKSRGYVDLSYDAGEQGRLRVNIGRHSQGLKACFRVLPVRPPTLVSLRLPEQVGHVARYHQGLAIVCGPMGAGKSTTLAALVDLINSQSAHHIITVEDPVEIVHVPKRSVVSQREVGRHTQSFARALKAALREDPDVIVIGELRDRETVEIAMTAAETGHLVIATLATRSAAKAIDRLIDLFAPEEQPQVRATLAGALKMVVGQRLITSLDGTLVPVCEIVTGNVPLWTLIRDNKLFQLPSLMQRGKALGMVRLDQSLQEWVNQHVISFETAKEFADAPQELVQAGKKASESAPYQNAHGGRHG